MVAPSSFYRMQSGSMALLAIAVLLMICSGFTIGLTFAPCHSSICVERWFPSQARFHIAVFYGGIGIAATFLAAWSRSKATRSVSDYYLTKVPLPLVGLYLSVGGTLLSAWILAFTMASTTYWFPAEHVFWHAKGIEGWCDRPLLRYFVRTGVLARRKEQSHLQRFRSTSISLAARPQASCIYALRN
jgi:hypothetical protein